MILTKIHKSIIALAVAMLTGNAFATTVDFQDVKDNGEIYGVPSPLQTRGYVFEYTPAAGEPNPTGLYIATRAWVFNRGGSNALYANSDFALTTLTKGDNSAFSIYAIDLAEVNGSKDQSPGNNITFNGKTTTGETVSITMQVDGKRGWQRFAFPDQFTNLVSLSWLQGGGPQPWWSGTDYNKIIMVDNLLLSGTDPTCKPGKAVGHCDDKFITLPPRKK